jgi:hypothetical protein
MVDAGRKKLNWDYLFIEKLGSIYYSHLPKQNLSCSTSIPHIRRKAELVEESGQGGKESNESVHSRL